MTGAYHADTSKMPRPYLIGNVLRNPPRHRAAKGYTFSK